MTKRLKITIGIPSPERVDYRFNLDLLTLIFNNWTKYDLLPCNTVSSRIVFNRNNIVKEAQKNNSDYILWIDSDTRFPVDGLQKLLAHDKEVVCATTCRRIGNDRSPAAYPLDIGSVVPFQQLVPMRFVGFPFMLTKMSVFDKIERPYFAEPPRRLIDVYEGKEYLPEDEIKYDVIPEDEYFCYLLRQAGIDIWCDMELTMQIGHIGTTVYYVQNPLPKDQPNGDIVFEEVRNDS